MADYTITGQLERNQYDPATGQVVPGVVVSARSVKTGTPFSVFVPQDRYTAAGVAMLVTHKLATVDAVADLTDTVPLEG